MEALGIDIPNWTHLSAADGQMGRGGGHASAGRSRLWVGICGPLTISHDGAESLALPLGQRAVLGLLALAAGSAISLGSIIAALWPDQDPPATADSIVYTYVSRLRSRFKQDSDRLISRDSSGYRLRLTADQLDVLAFRRFAGLAREAKDPRRACKCYEEAMRLWRGNPLADIDVLRAHPVAVALTNERIAVALEYADRADRSGRYDGVLPYVRALTSANPLDERLHAALMIALAGSGRQAEALRVYGDLRRRLDEELGIEPGEQLRSAHQKILRQEIVRAQSANAPADSVGDAESEPGRAVPRELPPAVPGFTGRTAELQALTRLLDRSAGQAPEAVVITAIGGTAGVGKTALAVQCAHQVADRFPDGQLYVNLRGYDPDRPMPAADALAGFLRALGVGGQDIPPGEDERAARYRSLLAGKKMLVVLDNAGSEEQVRPLLPGTSSCAVVVTSRDALAGLVARHGATRLELDLLPPPEAAGLLRELIGPRAEDDPGATAALAGQCCRLPLALRVAAELAAARPDVPLAGLVGELADQRRRLDMLDAGGDPRTAVRAVFSWSHRHLDLGTARAFRLAGLHPGADFDAYAVAALTGADLKEARRVLDALARAHLIQSAGPSRYGMHDLLRAHARELADVSDGEGEQEAALTRLFDHYLHTASAAMDALVPAERHIRPAAPQSITPAPSVSCGTAARAWLDAERVSLVAVTVHAAAHGWPAHATRLSATLHRYLEAAAHYPEASTIHDCARRAARDTGDQAAEAAALNGLGVVDWKLGRYPQAAGHFRQALALCRETGDRPGQARALNNLGSVDWGQGRYPQAAGHYRQALALCRETGDRHVEARTLNNLGDVELRQGRYPQATRTLEQALAVCRETGDRHVEAAALNGLGGVSIAAGQSGHARTLHAAALALAAQTGAKYEQARAHRGLGQACHADGNPRGARRHWQQALALFTELGTPEAEPVRAEIAIADHDSESRHTADPSTAEEVKNRQAVR